MRDFPDLVFPRLGKPDPENPDVDTYSYVLLLTYVRIRVIMLVNFIERRCAMKYSELERMLKKAGCWIDHEAKRHTMWYSPITGELFPVPRHQGQEAKTGTVNNILKAAGLK